MWLSLFLSNVASLQYKLSAKKFSQNCIPRKLFSFIHSFHSFSIYSHKKAINVYMFTCSEAVPQRCSHEQVLWKMRGKPTGEHPCRSMISMELPHFSIKITLPHGWIRRSSQNTPHKIPSEGLIRNALQQI